MLAGLLGWSQGTFASRLAFAHGACVVTREVDAGLETLSLKLPSVVTTDLRLNEPRYVSLPNLIKAKKKRIDTLTCAALAVDVAPRLVILKLEEPTKRRAGIRVESVAGLLDRLRNEAGVIL
jgi:electron transfer flavoprotein beta subunit